MLSAIKRTIRRVLPKSVVEKYRHARYGRAWFDAEGKSRQEVFSDIYRLGGWGGKEGEFYSGPGSDDPVAAPYIEALCTFVRQHDIKSVVDVGCGDFRVGRQIAGFGINYHGIDIVPELIASHQRLNAGGNVQFSCRDVSVQAAPQADLCLIRQVLQHLGNEQVLGVLKNCSGFRHLIVTEHVVPAERVVADNVDISCGPETRVDRGSCLRLDRPPFNRVVSEILCEVQLPDGTIIQTFVVEPSARV